jgi:hypothetical protein
LALTCASFALLCAGPARVRADSMDLALSRLRIIGEKCQQGGSGSSYCPDQELFERLVSELAVAMAPAVNAPARGAGPRSFRLGLDTTITTIEADESYWALGTEGSGGDVNAAPQPVLVWNRAQVHKGLPFGFELGAALGQGAGTSLWTFGVALKWALVEGFYSGLGRLPDVSIQAGVDRSVGSSQAAVTMYAFDLTLSKPFVIEHAWSIAPFTGVQTLFTRIESGAVDLTPGGPADPARDDQTLPNKDAYNACAPLPGNQRDSTPPAPLVCSPGGDGSDFKNDVVFDPVHQTRVRMFLGGQARYEMLIVSLSLLFDLVAPTLAAAPLRHLESPDAARQLAINIAIGAVL